METTPKWIHPRLVSGERDMKVLANQGRTWEGLQGVEKGFDYLLVYGVPDGNFAATRRGSSHLVAHNRRSSLKVRPHVLTQTLRVAMLNLISGNSGGSWPQAQDDNMAGVAYFCTSILTSKNNNRNYQTESPKEFVKTQDQELSGR